MTTKVDLPIELLATALANTAEEWLENRNKELCETKVGKAIRKVCAMLETSLITGRGVHFAQLLLALSPTLSREDCLEAGRNALYVLRALDECHWIRVAIQEFENEAGETVEYNVIMPTSTFKEEWVSIPHEKRRFEICGDALTCRFTKGRRPVKGYESIRPKIRYSKDILALIPFINSHMCEGTKVWEKLSDHYQEEILRTLQERSKNESNFFDELRTCLRGDDARGRDITLDPFLNYQGNKRIRASLELETEFIDKDTKESSFGFFYAPPKKEEED
jgi:hypothetical protein